MLDRQKLLVSCAAVAVVSALPASAQVVDQSQTPARAPQGVPPASPADDVEADAIIVTGIRNSLRKSLDVKRNAIQFVDSVVAEDIGKLPVNNIAESLQQVSGVQIRRAFGQGANVSVRGLRQNRIEVNGRTLVSAYGRGNGSPVDSDFNPLSLYPSEIISRLEVYKLLSADQIDGSIGGTVNIVTVRPLDLKDTLVSLTAETTYGEQIKKFDTKVNAFYATQTDDGRIGFSANVLYARNFIYDDEFNVGSGWVRLPLGVGANPNNPNGDGVAGQIQADLRYQRVLDRRTRLAGNFTLQWKPSDTIELISDYTFSKAQSPRQRRWLSVVNTQSLTAPNYACAECSFTLSDDGDEAVVAATALAGVQSNTEVNDVRTFNSSFALGGRAELGRFTVRAAYEYSDAEVDQPMSFARLQTRNDVLVSYDFRDGGVPELSIPSSANLLDPASWRYQNVFDNRFLAKANENAGRVDINYDTGLDFLRSVDIGGRYSRLSTLLDSRRNQLTPNTILLTSVDPRLYTNADIGNFLNGRVPAAEQYLAPVIKGTGSSFVCTEVLGPCTPTQFEPAASYRIIEENRSGYIKVNYDTELFNIPIAGNVGVRYVEIARQSSSAFLSSPGVFTPVTFNSTTRNWLPSAVLKASLRDNLLLRLGAAKVIGLPDSAQLAPSLTVLGTFGTATAGNPSLRPFSANQYDVALEWYFGDSAALTVGAFYKDVAAFTINQVTREPIPGALNTDATNTVDFNTNVFLVSRVVNGGQGSITGFELLYRQPLTFLPAPFDGLGIEANYSYITSETPQRDRAGRGIPIQGLSRHNLNVAGFYEKGRYSARLTYNYRSSYVDLTTVTGDPSIFAPFGTMDASLRYALRDNWSVSLEGTNLTKADIFRYTGAEYRINSYQQFGRRVTVSSNFKF